jgi:hypothetical protein
MTGTIDAQLVPETGQLVGVRDWRWVVVAGAPMSDEPSQGVCRWSTGPTSDSHISGRASQGQTRAT